MQLHMNSLSNEKKLKFPLSQSSGYSSWSSFVFKSFILSSEEIIFLLYTGVNITLNEII